MIFTGHKAKTVAETVQIIVQTHTNTGIALKHYSTALMFTTTGYWYMWYRQ